MTTGAPRAQGSAAEPLRLTLGTATPGGGFPEYGAALVEAVREVDPGLVIEARNTKGSAENVPLLAAGSLDLALVQGEFAYEALAHGKARAVTAMYGSPGLFAVRADSPIRAISDLRGKAVALGAKGSGLTQLGRAVLASLGIDPDRDIEAVYLDRAGDGPAMVADGRVAGLWGGGLGWPGFRAMAEGPGGARFIAPSEAEIGRILAAQPSLRPMSVPAGSYKGQDAALPTVGSWSLVLARPGLDEGAAHRLAAALDRAGPGLARRLPAARETSPASTLAAVAPALIHPGVRRYLVEAGRLRP